jgi:hypothetical protein
VPWPGWPSGSGADAPSCALRAIDSVVAVTDHPRGAGETDSLQVSQQGVDGGRPRLDGTKDRIAMADDLAGSALGRRQGLEGRIGVDRCSSERGGRRRPQVGAPSVGPQARPAAPLTASRRGVRRWCSNASVSPKTSRESARGTLPRRSPSHYRANHHEEQAPPTAAASSPGRYAPRRGGGNTVSADTVRIEWQSSGNPVLLTGSAGMQRARRWT